MSLQLIRRAFEKRLLAVSAGLATAYENDDFTPVTEVPYQRANLLPNDPDNQQMGDQSYTERGLFQITLAYPYGKGSGAADARAQALRTQFKRGLTLTESGLLVHVIKTPKVSPALVDAGRYFLPITVEWQCHVNTP